MKLNLSTLSFGSYIDKGGGTPSWGTELGQSKPDYKFTVEGCEEILVGMLYNFNEKFKYQAMKKC